MSDGVSKPDWKWDDFYPAEREAATVGRQDRRRARAGGQPRDRLATRSSSPTPVSLRQPPNWTWDDFRAARQADPTRRRGEYGGSASPPTAGAKTPSGTYVPMLWEAGRRRPSTPTTARRVQLRRRRQGADRAAADGRHRQVACTSTPPTRTGSKLMNSGKVACWSPARGTSSSAARYRLRRPGHADLRRIERQPIRRSAGPDNWVAFNNGDQTKQAAIDFVKWLTAPSRSRTFSWVPATCPPRLSVGQDPAFVAKLDEQLPGRRDSWRTCPT